ACSAPWQVSSRPRDTSASKQQLGTGTLSTSCGYSCSPASMCGDRGPSASAEMTATPSAVRIAVLARCPRCAEGALFRGYLSLATCCAVCGLDFATFDVGDSAVSLVILVVGAFVCAAALWV